MSNKKEEGAKARPEETGKTGAGASSGAETAEPEKSGLPVEETEKLRIELESLKTAHEELNDLHMRLRAEYDNFRKRSIKERESVYADAVCDVVAAILPVYDNLERALKTPTEDAAFLKGVDMTHRQFAECLSKLGVSEIPAEGKPFDPALHDAVMHVEDGNLEENVVAEVFQKGFQIGDRVIRHAMVKVAN